MWPFRKKVDLSSMAMSGVLTCDGKHHHWSEWRDIRLKAIYYRPWMAGPVETYSNAQERTCVVCNYRERRDVDED